MRFKRLLALLLAAALALSLLAGCGGRNQSLSQMLLNLLDGQYQNVSVEIDSDLETKLRQAISQSDTDEELRAALEQLLGGGISFQRLGSGQQGDTAWTLIIYPGTDPDAAARSVYLDLDKVFAALPDDGVYSSGFAMAEMENGYAILVKATVDKAGTEDKPDPVTLTGISVSGCKTEYFVGQSFDPTGMTVTATYSDNSTKTITGITETDKKNVSWDTEKFTNAGTKTVTISYGGKTTTVSVTVEEPTVKSLTVEPASLAFELGESFTPANIQKVTAGYTDGNDKEININDCDLTITPPNGDTPETVDKDYQFMTEGSYTLTVSYKGKDDTVDITVNPATVTGIEVTSNPTKMTYISGESFDPAGMTITATYSDGTTKPVTSDYTCSPETVTKDNNVVTISYGGQSTTVEVTILDGNNSYDADTNTYSIATAEGLQAWNEAVQSDPSLHCTLTADINLTGREWTPVGNSGQTYNGTFDGQGYSITGLAITTNSTGGENAVLFGSVGSNGTVKNLQLKDVNCDVQQNGVAGGIANSNYGTITACSVTGEIKANNGAAGGIAVINFGTITACWFDGNLTTSYDNGGIAAYNYSTITTCFYGGNAGHGAYNQGGTIDATKVDNSTVTWQTAVGGMNAALTGNDYQWALGTGILPTLKKQ